MGQNETTALPSLTHRGLLPIHLRISLADGRRLTLQTLARSTGAALSTAHELFGDAMRGASAQAFLAPGFVMSMPGALQQRAAANDARFAEVLA